MGGVLRGVFGFGSIALVALVSSASATPTVARADGLALPLPSGWRAVERSLTDCSHPGHRLAIGGDGGPAGVHAPLAYGTAPARAPRPATVPGARPSSAR